MNLIPHVPMLRTAVATQPFATWTYVQPGRLHIAPNDDAMRSARDGADHVAMALSVCALAQRTAVIGK
jgi:hypothetical protein